MARKGICENQDRRSCKARGDSGRPVFDRAKRCQGLERRSHEIEREVDMRARWSAVAADEPKRWRCVAFDLDGTLVNSLPALRRAYDAFLAEFELCGSDAEFEMLNGPSMSTIVALLKDRHGLQPSADELLARYYDHVERAYQSGIAAAEGAEELLRWVADAGLHCALVTSSPRRAVETALDRLGWRDRFAAVVCGDDVARAKPDPAVYARALGSGGWARNECVAVEDATDGVRSAVGAGMDAIAVGPVDRFDVLWDAGAHWLCTSLTQVRGLIGGLAIDD